MGLLFRTKSKKEFRYPTTVHFWFLNFWIIDSHQYKQNYCTKLNKMSSGAIERNIENCDLRITDTNVEFLLKKTNNVTKSHKCNQCDYTSLDARNLRRHLKAHSGEKSNKCNQCNFASSWATALRRHVRTHNGDKFNKENKWNYLLAHSLRRHAQLHTNK